MEIKFSLFEKKTEKEAVEDRYKEYRDKIKTKKEEIIEINNCDDPQTIKNVRSKIKKVELDMAEKELDIVILRDKKLQYKKELKDAEKREKDKK